MVNVNGLSVPSFLHFPYSLNSTQTAPGPKAVLRGPVAVSKEDSAPAVNLASASLNAMVKTLSAVLLGPVSS